MAVTIIPAVSRALYDGMASVNIGGVAGTLYDAEGNMIVGDGPVQVAPSLVTPGAITPASGPVGTVFTLTPPVFSGSPTPTVTRTVTLAGSPITVTGNSYTSTSAGALAAAWSASNGVGSPATSSASATVTAAGSAPVITQQPSITPSSATVGDSVTLNLGAATGADSPPTWTLMRGATDVTAQVDEFMAIEFTTAGTYTLSVSWSNATGPTTATPATITVAEAPSGDVDLSDAAIYIPNTSVTPTDITTLVAGGRSSVTFSAEGTGTAPQVTSRGLDFAVPGQKLASPSVNIAGGFFVTGIAEYDTVAGTIVSVYGANDSNLNIRANSGNRVQINWSYPAATNQNLPIGSLAAGVPAIFGVEVNPTANTLRYWDGTQVVSRALGGSPGAVLPDAVIRLGGVAHATNERMDGAVSRFVLEPLDGAQITFEQALAELGAPVTPPFP